MMIFYAFLLVVVVVGFLMASLYNRFVRLRNGAEEAYKTIDVFTKQRFDLIPNLVNTVKGYMQHESETLQKIVELRSRAMGQSGHSEANSENALSGALKSVFALAENYPDLKANQDFLQLQQQLAVLEEQIQRARRYYNASARDLNNAVESFPGNLIAGTFGFRTMDYYEVDQAETQPVKVQF
jgi:LemA protein